MYEMEGKVVVTNLDFADPEGEPSTIALGQLFAPEAGDPQMLISKACDEIGEGDESPPQDGKKGACTVDDFVMLPEALLVLWYDADVSQTQGMHRARVPWKKLGNKLRKDGPACSFVWGELGPSEDVETDGGADPCL
jgi:hypothetical protein